MSFDAERLYGLLPEIYRLRDAPEGQLRALIEVLAEQIAVIEEDLAQLYDDQFIETCAEWVVPYLGELVGHRALYAVSPATASTRAEVANTIAYRRRKGTASVLEQLARDVTGWDAHVVELFRRVATNQWLNHPRPEHRSLAALRPAAELTRLGTPFSAVPRTVEVRRIGRGRYNLPNLGVYLWRLRAYRVIRGTAKKQKPGCYSFHPLGIDAPLFTAGRPEETLTQLLGPENAPGPLERRALYAELHAFRQALADGEPPASAARRAVHFDPSDPVFQIAKQGVPIPPAELLICDLSAFTRPPAKLSYKPRGAGPAVELPIQAAVDPVLGRVAFPAGVDPGDADVVVSFHYGAPGDYGGGPYDRPDRDASPATHVLSRDLGLAQAVAALGSGSGIIEIPDSATLPGDLSLALASGQRLTLRAATGTRPVLSGLLQVTSGEGAELVLDGLLIARPLVVQGAARMTLILSHTTLAPTLEAAPADTRGPPALRWDGDGTQGRLRLSHSLSGRLIVGEGVEVELLDSLIDGGADERPVLAGSEDGRLAAGLLLCRRGTVIGRVHVRLLTLVEDSLATGPVLADRRQEGCLRYSFLPSDSEVPRRYRCLPEGAVRRAIEARRRERRVSSRAEEAAFGARVRARLKPVFTSLRYGDPAYGQLHRSGPAEIREGAEDGAELGVFHDLMQHHRERNLAARLEEYLPLGLEAGVFYVT